MRPADALFSTLDFASNAIGSAVLGVHQKVTQAHANGRRDSQSSAVDRSRTPDLSTSFSQQKSWGREETASGHRDFPEKTDRLALLNPKLDVVGTGLGALESLGKKAAGAIADVVRAKSAMIFHMREELVSFLRLLCFLFIRNRGELVTKHKVTQEAMVIRTTAHRLSR